MHCKKHFRTLESTFDVTLPANAISRSTDWREQAGVMFSVILPVGEDLSRLEWTIQSLRAQTSVIWELLAVDFGSQDGRNESLQAWPCRDPRIRVGMVVRNRCPAAARNAALQRARGEFITYLDPGDEYYPNYLAEVAASGQENDVLLSAFDITYEDASADGRPATWDPGQVIDRLFAENIAPPLAVAHRRSVLERVGGFNELLWRGEDWDFWKRLVRAGLRFRCLRSKSGRHSAEADRANHKRTPTPLQLQTMAANWQAGRPLFAVGQVANLPEKSLQRPLGNVPHVCATASSRKVESIAFVSPHCLLDFTNGAAIATRDGLHLLADLGFQCEAFCGTRLDESQECLIEAPLARRGEHPSHVTIDGNLPVTLFENVSTPGRLPGVQDAEAFLTGCEAFLRRKRPDVVWTYGGDPVAIAVQRLVKRLGIPVLFAVHNFGYGRRETFEAVDYAVVPCDFSRRYYMETLGLACQVLPNIVNWKAAQAPNRNRRFLTFINPKDIKGVYVFARIARELARRRPDIPILVTQGRSRPDALSEPGLGLAPHIAGQFPIETRCDGRNITTMPFAPDPGTFYPAVYGVTKLLLMPSLWYESFGLVAAEAMLNGIPVLASNRGALPETIGGSPHPGPLPQAGEGGILFEIPAKYTSETRDVPTAEEVEPWVETIIRLWDDAAVYERWSRAARERAQQWHPDRLAPIYREFFGHLTHQPGPPLVPRGFGDLRD